MGEALGAILAMVLGFGAIALFTWLAARKPEDPTPRQPTKTIRCPYCGSPATVKGSYWECGYCGDSGRM